MEGSFDFNFAALSAFIDVATQAAEAGPRNPDIRNGLEGAQGAYLGDMRQRFAAEGNGEWRPLAAATQAERQRQGFGPAHPILKRLGLLEGALTPGQPGNVFEPSADGFRAGYGGEFRHPGYTSKKGKRTGVGVKLSAIAAFHQNGGGKLFARPPLKQPTTATLQRMEQPISDGVRAMLQRAVASVNT